MNTDMLRKKLGKLGMGETLGPIEVDIGILSVDPAFQVRRALVPTNLERLRSAYKSGRDVAPITVAVISEDRDRLAVIDGHHRFTVLESLVAEGGRQHGSQAAQFTTVKATFVKLSRVEAQWQAAAANMTHGQPLSGKEVRAAFRRFVKAGHHRKADGGFKSFREIAKEFGKTHPTMRAWMMKDFPGTARRMESDSTGNLSALGVPSRARLVKHTAIEAIRSVSACFDDAVSGDRAEIVEAVRSLLIDIEEAQRLTSPWVHDEELRNRQHRGEGDGPESDF